MIILVLLIYSVNGQLSCPEIFTQEPKSPIPNRWYGSVTLQSQQNLNGLWLILQFDRRVNQLGSFFGEVLPKNDENVEFLVKNHKTRLQANTPESVRFFVQYDGRNPPPKLVSAKLNGNVLCSERDLTLRFDDREQCGTVVIQASPLITFGAGVPHGNYPWHVAVYQQNYVCGGSLIAKSYVISAGHCVFKKYRRLVEASDVTVHMGKHYLSETISDKVQVRAVSEIKLHPAYNSTNYRNDLALLKLEAPVDITDFVRTVCLWEHNRRFQNEGFVTGWGYDETGTLSEELLQAVMPIIPQETCIFSNPDFYSRFTSENTFCAGYRNRTSVCNGDSGGGMVFKSDSRWFLRGIVSLAVPLVNYTCDSSQYVIFTDVAKYLDWIKQSIAN